MRHDGADHADDAEEIGIEDCLRLLDRALFGRGRRDAKAGVVDQQIDMPFKPQHLVDRRRHRFIAGHIQRQHLKRAFTVLPLRAAAAAAIHPVTGFDELLGGDFADTR